MLAAVTATLVAAKTGTLPKGGKADRDEDESDGAAALSLSLLAGVALFAA